MLAVCLLISAMKITENGTVLCGLFLKPYNLSLIMTEAPETLTLEMVNKIYDRHSSRMSVIKVAGAQGDMMNQCHVIS